jgi:DNA repair exonuclease SbcCD ATPase subunit
MVMMKMMDLHLTRTIEREHSMSKYSDISAKLKGVRTRFDAQLEDLDKEIDSVATDSDEVVRHHASKVAEIKAGVEEMREGIKEMSGNGGDEKIATFPEKKLGTG